AHRAGHPDVGQEVHVQAVGAVALTGLAAAARLVEAEPARLVAAHLRLGQFGEQGADLVEDLDVRRRVGARRPADGRLVDVDHLVDVLGPRDPVVRADRHRLAVGRLLVVTGRLAPAGRLVVAPAVGQVHLPQGLLEDVVDQRALARAADPRDAHEQAQGHLDVYALEVVVAGPEHREALAVAGAALAGDGDLPGAG